MTLNDDAFEAAFQNASLDPALFSHKAHLRLAWIHITQDGTNYNETVTVAAVFNDEHVRQRYLEPDLSPF